MRKYTSSDYDIISKWFLARHISAPPMECIPPNGMVVDGLAAGFLILTDSKVAILEYFVSNPKADKKDRSDSMIDIANALKEVARNLKFRLVVCNSQLENVKQLLNILEFSYLGEFSSYSKEL